MLNLMKGYTGKPENSPILKIWPVFFRVKRIIVLCSDWSQLTFTDKSAIDGRVHGPILFSRGYFVFIETAIFVDGA